MIKKYLPYLVLLAAIIQLFVAYFAATQGFFNEESNLRLFIQPAGYAFSIWGLIYTFATLYAVYQVIPANDNEILRQNRMYTLILFIGSSLWLYASNLSLAWLWTTVVVLAVMGYVGYKAVTVSAADRGSKRITAKNFFSFQSLIIYAAWTNIAQFVNVGAMSVEYKLFESGTLWLVLNTVFLLVVVIWLYRQFSQLRYSFWYGFIVIWALVGIFIANGESDGSMLIAYCAAVLTIPFVMLSLYRLRQIVQYYSITIESK